MSGPSYNSICIQNLSPLVDGGLYPVKRRVGSWVVVNCEAFCHGHDKIRVMLKYRLTGRRKWQETPMDCLNAGLDLYEGGFTVEEMGSYEFAISAYMDHFENWRSDTKKKYAAGDNIDSELLAGEVILEKYALRAPKTAAKKIRSIITEAQTMLSYEDRVERILGDQTFELASLYPARDGMDIGHSAVCKIRVDRKKAEYASWYEIFPRSAGKVEGQSGTFKDVEMRLPYISGMGFDVLYFPPIHPIGLTKRKGKNNSLTAKPGEPGSPYAIGDASGGHFAIHADLGTLDDFDNLIEVCKSYDIEVALDFALNCSPDHEYLKSHPDWFYRRPDGSIKFAENPPKKYEDIYPLNFECEDRKNLWDEIRDCFLFWAGHGVRIFRVDNPHTKPSDFWKWCIEEVQKKYPDVIFLAEAFTKPRLLESLAKIGFNQSYGYFTWRESKQELQEYFEYLNQSPVKEYMISNIFPTTPDILPKHLQHASDEMFKIRLALAATLSPVYGMYSGVELCENIPASKDELLNSEKYEFKVRDFAQPNSLAPFVSQLNRIRRQNLALQSIGNLEFHKAHNDKILCYTKESEGNLLLICVNLDPYHTQECKIEFPYWKFNLPKNYKVHDLLTDAVYKWNAQGNFISLNPHHQVAHIFRVFG